MTDHGVISEIAAIVGLDAAIKLCEALGGQRVYIPRADTVLRDLRNEQIRQDYKAGKSVNQIAGLHHITTRMVFHILETHEE